MDGFASEGSAPVAMLPPRAGRLLVASPSLTDPNFERTVVLLLDVGADGALGVVLNRPSHVEVGAVLDDWAGIGTAPELLFHGGPVETDSALALARLHGTVAGDDPVGWRRVYGDVGLVDLDTPVPVVAGSFDSFRIFAGYAGWGAGQVEDEIGEGAWYVVESRPGDAFWHDADALWAAVLRRQGGRLAMVSTWTPDPRMN